MFEQLLLANTRGDSDAILSTTVTAAILEVHQILQWCCIVTYVSLQTVVCGIIHQSKYNAIQNKGRRFL